ncbi:MAG: hypothetical protein Q7R66_04375 [Undibacterium sp.]|uniref:hypothetical protein n=1 Tax=Undibacterium sp. TaxID=1914977 RepID=UPI00271CDA05|nr:hypothetical protein [Undibacterium sp.]MDO8651403.1 hypothetical protein [Undibacterium sp.]
MSSFSRFAMSSAAALVLATSATSVFAHDDAYLDTLKSPNGGQTRMADAYHFELVMVKDSEDVKENQIMVYVTDHAGTKILTAGATGTATVLAGKVKTTATLVPDGDNRLKGIAKYASTADVKAVLSITLAGKPAEQARFTPFVVAKDAHTEHKH